MSKQTAVEWLIEEYAKAFKIPVNAVMQETIQQAKEMEKEQIVDAWNGGDFAYFYSKETGRDFTDGEDYYNEIYKKQQ